MTIASLELRRTAAVVALVLCWCLAVAARAAEGCAPLPRGLDFALGAHADARGLLWRVRAPDGRASVLLGTMHVDDPRVRAVADAVRPALLASRHYALEIVLDPAAAAALQSAMFDDRARLSQALGPALFRRAAGYLALRGIPSELAESLRPWAAFALLSQPPAGDGLPLDFALMAEAAAAGKPVSGLETVAEQVAVFERMGQAEALAMLREVVCHYDVMQADLQRMIERYAARDLAGLTRHALKYVDATRLPMLEDLLWSRNRRMVERMQPLLAAGDGFVAIGAMHLPGDRGVLRLLEQRGYTVEAIY